MRKTLRSSARETVRRRLPEASAGSVRAESLRPPQVSKRNSPSWSVFLSTTCAFVGGTTGVGSRRPIWSDERACDFERRGLRGDAGAGNQLAPSVGQRFGHRVCFNRRRVRDGLFRPCGRRIAELLKRRASTIGEGRLRTAVRGLVAWRLCETRLDVGAVSIMPPERISLSRVWSSG